jgi:tetratricopeptide (TPR) repeat protein
MYRSGKGAISASSPEAIPYIPAFSPPCCAQVCVHTGDHSLTQKLLISTAAQQAQAHIQAGRIDKAEALLTPLAASQDCDAEIHHQLGLVYARQGRPSNALEQIAIARSKEPTSLEHTLLYGRLLLSLGRHEEGLSVLKAYPLLSDCPATVLTRFGDAMLEFGHAADAANTYRAAVERDSSAATACFKLAGALHALKRTQEAETAIRKAITLNPLFAEAHNNLGILLLSRSAISEAIQEFQIAISQKPEYAAAYNNLGNAQKAAGDFASAEAAFRKALAVKPDYADALGSLAAVLKQVDRKGEAIAIYRSALARSPGHPALLHGLANILAQDPTGGDEAIAMYRRLIALKAGTFEAYRQLGVTLCRQHRIAEAFEWFTRGAQASAASHRKSNTVREQHEKERHEYLKALGQTVTPLGGRTTGNSIRKPTIHVEEHWEKRCPQIVTIDSLLTDDALHRLREFCWQADIWHETFDEGYLGATPESGLACPLLAQIAEDLRLTYPAIFQDHPLVYLWAFKYGAGLRGTKVHADFAAVNVNFWITDDSANIDPATGGLVIWDKPAPLDWDFEKYNRDESAMRGFLAEEKADKLIVPYRSNRAVIFDSDLFHETDAFSFKQGYCNRRINITLLFGYRK